MIEEITDEQAEKIEQEEKQKKAEEEKKTAEEKKAEEDAKKAEEDTDKENQDENKEEQIDSSSKGKKEKTEEEKAMDAMKKMTGQMDLMQIDEGDREVKEENKGTRRLLNGFKMLNVQIHLLSDDLDKIFTKAKYKDLFDIGVLSSHSCNYVGKEGSQINNIFKQDAKVHIETVDQLCIMKKEQKAEFRKKIVEKCEAAGWEASKEVPFSHHMLYKVKKD